MVVLNLQYHYHHIKLDSVMASPKHAVFFSLSLCIIISFLQPTPNFCLFLSSRTQTLQCTHAVILLPNLGEHSSSVCLSLSLSHSPSLPPSHSVSLWLPPSTPSYFVIWPLTAPWHDRNPAHLHIVVCDRVVRVFPAPGQNRGRVPCSNAGNAHTLSLLFCQVLSWFHGGGDCKQQGTELCGDPSKQQGTELYGDSSKQQGTELYGDPSKQQGTELYHHPSKQQGTELYGDSSKQQGTELYGDPSKQQGTELYHDPSKQQGQNCTITHPSNRGQNCTITHPSNRGQNCMVTHPSNRRQNCMVTHPSNRGQNCTMTHPSNRDRTVPSPIQATGDRTVPSPIQATGDRNVPSPIQATGDRTVPSPIQARGHMYLLTVAHHPSNMQSVW